jgi:hypothetical protein
MYLKEFLKNFKYKEYLKFNPLIKLTPYLLLYQVQKKSNTENVKFFENKNISKRKNKFY